MSKPKTTAERQAAWRKKNKDNKLVEVRLQVTPEHARLIAAYAASLKDGASL